MKEISITGRSMVKVNILGAMGLFMKEISSMVYQTAMERDFTQVHFKVITLWETSWAGN